ncbi:FMN-dependent NADH-azoreductase [Mycoplasma sp. Pen4]|uniref:FMN-dependent NADH-azoreductase n=1 Tax=Mycoplasma sp. Pen4 TaxID=640330 RepID=UPI001654838F|nr:FMN-dependent NADH-azoreductase [Mycoplasma sp. Pen4]QNM93797.1 FMN-dependent NADH-azoreductase [Mycoplasma sp. Pen4]
MKKILLLDGNVIPNEQSHLFNIMNYIETQYQNHSDFEVERHNLNNTKHAEIFLTANNMSTYWNDIDSDMWINKLKEIDTLVISMPMINFGPSVIVKNFIDSIAVANKTFSYKYSKKGDAIGLLTNLNVIIVATQGAPEGWYLWGQHVEWLEGTFKFLGAQSVKSIKHFGTKVKPLSDIAIEDTATSIKDKIDETLDLN